MSHTTKQLRAEDCYIYEVAGDYVASTESAFKEEEEEQAIARRLVACWNACQGIETESLESGLQRETKPIAFLALRNMDLFDKTKILEKERDEALDVLRELAHGEYTDELGNRAVAILAKRQKGG